MIPWIDTTKPDWDFPPADQALDDPNGLLCAGADLRPTTLLRAYRRGLFPWYSEGQPVLWWSPSPRALFFPNQVHISKRLARTLRTTPLVCRLDEDFSAVIHACANTPRPGQDGTWITPEMIDAYCQLHELGHAHCLGVYRGNALVGGIYGLAIGRGFFGESMFSRERDASKIGLVTFCRWLEAHQFGFLDAQVESQHILNMGAQLIDQNELLGLIGVYCEREGVNGSWRGLS